MQAVRRKQSATTGPIRSDEEPAPQSEATPADDQPSAPAAVDLLPSADSENIETTGSLEETPEWQPHPAMSEAPADEPPESAADAESSVAITEAPEESWAEPTPTAMTEASVWEEPDLNEPAGAMAEAEFDTSEPDLVPTEGAEVEDPVPARVTDEPFTTEPAEDPFATSPIDGPTPRQEQASLAEVSAGVAAEQNIPEEEPFERAGRWWFKRGAELLVYNEQTGEWMPSPTPLPNVESPNGEATSSSHFGPEASVTQTISDISALEPEPEPEPEEMESTAQQGFWKCPTCGAVNGSTAATCRMCFAARPAG